MPKRAGKYQANWNPIGDLPPKGYRCGYCDKQVAPNKGWWDNSSPQRFRAFACSFCGRPTLFDGQEQAPGAAYGEDVNHLPDDLDTLYREARDCVAVEAHTAAVMVCRKILMHVAVDMKAKKGEDFQFYVDYLFSESYIPPNSKAWVDQIRKKGNFANHKIPLVTKADAEDMVTFTQMLLKIIYEFPAKGAPVPPAPTP